MWKQISNVSTSKGIKEIIVICLMEYNLQAKEMEH
jgi:hypothetical protein